MASSTKAREYQLKIKYGLTLQEYESMLESQDGRCAICKQIPKRTLCVDHVHVKGYKSMDLEDKRKYVRGLLCFLCNTGLKGFERTSDGERNRQSLEGTYKYFKKYPLKGETNG